MCSPRLSETQSGEWTATARRRNNGLLINLESQTLELLFSGDALPPGYPPGPGVRATRSTSGVRVWKRYWTKVWAGEVQNRADLQALWDERPRRSGNGQDSCFYFSRPLFRPPPPLEILVQIDSPSHPWSSLLAQCAKVTPPPLRPAIDRLRRPERAYANSPGNLRSHLMTFWVHR